MTPLTRDDTVHGETYYIASEADEQLALAIGTLESRERNIETILAESARRQAELAKASRSLEILTQHHARANAEVLRLAAIVRMYEPGTPMVLN